MLKCIHYNYVASVFNLLLHYLKVLSHKKNNRGQKWYQWIDLPATYILKGSVSQDLRWVLLYINRKLSLRPIKNVNFIKGLVHNLHKTGRRTLVL